MSGKIRTSPFEDSVPSSPSLKVNRVCKKGVDTLKLWTKSQNEMTKCTDELQMLTRVLGVYISERERER